MVSSFYDYGQPQKKVRSLMETTLEMRRDKKKSCSLGALHNNRLCLAPTTLYHTSTLYTDSAMQPKLIDTIFPSGITT